MTPQETAIRKTLGSRLLPEPPASRDPELQARIDAALASAEPVRVPAIPLQSSSSHWQMDGRGPTRPRASPREFLCAGAFVDHSDQN